MKRMVCLILAFLLSCTAISCPIAGNAEEEGVQFAQEAEFLKKLEVLPDDFEASKNLTRAEFLGLITNIVLSDVDYTGLAGEGNVFADVDENHPYYQRILACKNLNLIKGDDRNCFHPDREITLTEALALMIHTLNYTIYANAAGGYPTGYYAVSGEIGLLKGLSMEYNGVMNGDSSAKLMYNALFADLAEVNNLSASGVHITIHEGKNYLSEKLGIAEYDAQVTDNGISCINGASLEDFQRVVLTETKTGKTVTAYYGDTNIAEYLGYRVKAFVRHNEESGRDEILHFSVHRNVKENVIPSSRVIQTDNTFIEFETEKDSGKYRKINFSYPPDVVYNGVYQTIYDHQIFAPDDGFVHCVDNDGDGKAELINIVSFNCYGSIKQQGTARNIIADSFDAEENILYCKFNSAMNLDLDEEKANYRICGDGRPLNQLKEKDVVSVAQAAELIDGKPFYLLFVTNRQEKGTLDSISAEAAELNINGTDYPVSSSILGIKPNYLSRLSFGSEIEIWLDAVGNAAYISSDSGASKNYAYLIGAMLEDGLEDSVKLKVFTKEEQIKVYELSSKTTIDGKKYDSPAQQLAALKERSAGSSPIAGAPAYEQSIARPIILEVNTKGEVSSVDTDNPNYATDTGAENQYTNQTHIRYSDEEAEDEKALKAAYRAPMTAKYQKSSRSVDGKFVLNNDTVILSVPDIDCYGLDQYSKYAANQDASYIQPFSYDLIQLYEQNREDANYETLSAASLNTSYAYDIQAYDIDPDTGTAGLAVIRGRRDVYLYQQVPSTISMAVFLRTSSVYDEVSDKIITKLYYTFDGKQEESATADPEELLFSCKYLIFGCDSSENPYKIAVPALQKGDVIRVIKSREQLTYLERVFRLEDVETTMCSNLYPTNSRFPYGTTASAGMVMPNDVRNYWGGLSQSYMIGIAYPRKVMGNAVVACIGLNTLKSIDFSRTSSYADQYFDISGAKIITIDRQDSGEMKVSEGSVSDIVPLNKVGGGKKNSILLFKHLGYQFDQLFVLNGYGEDK